MHKSRIFKIKLANKDSEWPCKLSDCKSRVRIEWAADQVVLSRDYKDNRLALQVWSLLAC